MQLNLTTVFIGVAIAAAVLTLLVGFVKKGHKSWLLTFLQNFAGVFFIFSGMVKAVDPLGTAYKLEQYFAEFESTFEGTWFSFISPIFPFFNDYAVQLSVFVIIVEIVVGLMLVMGMKTKFTSWAFLAMVGFFTFLTGFTYLTGYVPSGVNFFSFGSWADYDANNMKVTDCGCFGDFLKLEPKVSFFKDLILLIPAFFFVFKHKDMHQLFTKKIRWAIAGATTVGLLIYCLSNYVWDLPHNDFRPFRKGANVGEQYEAELNSMANVQILAWKLQNKNEPAKVIELSHDVYMKEFKNYPKTEWTVVDQVKSEPEIPSTKISEFEVVSIDDYDASDVFLEQEGYKIMIVSHKMKGDVIGTATRTVIDTITVVDTIQVEDAKLEEVVRTRQEAVQTQVEYNDYGWDEAWLADYIDKIKPIALSAKEDEVPVGIVAGGAGPELLNEFRIKTGLNVDYYTADDILLKTIIRSNPGVVLWKDGVILDKWHISKLPSWEEMKKTHF